MKSFLQEVSLGLSKKNKELSSKWFYDFRGSKLFEQITKLKEYYPTRTEIKILKDNKIEIANKIGKKAVLIEPGAGDIKKIGIFLSSLDMPKKYVPLDILANGVQIAKGEVVMVGERFGIRFTEVADPEERVQNL